MLEKNNKKTTQSLTIGQTLVGLNFNPSNDPNVDQIKRRFAEVIDFLFMQSHSKPGQLGSILTQTAINEIMSAQMWAIKALTFDDPIAEKKEESKIVV